MSYQTGMAPARAMEDDSDVESLVDRERAVSKIRSMSECAMERMEV